MTKSKKSRGKSSRNRTAGHTWERIVVQMLRNSNLYPHAVTTRSANRARDGEGIDICNANEAEHGRMHFDIQAKNTSGSLNIEELISRMQETDPNGQRKQVIFWKRTAKRGGRFIEKGSYAVLPIEQFLDLMKHHINSQS